ncbi:heterokaryon incompatibility protein-domain-containing protein [Stachybotrys elegans]|uniref:Heterokaryon incompatibility protein-domain-containing protein n=1 Tax=Stachybotrys elegans TaxID=80388 RepID=A0A8K0WKF9_9HYPO|nr:heterokaryon incompatibility protein-domain-containing protein [Stachybotrys elegans]
MRLINAKSRGLEEFTQDEAPPYAILSHRWGDAEVTFDDVRSPNSLYQSKDGYFKLDKCCAQALKDGLEFVWIDTCCIDKSSSAELSESINSMFSRYKNARFCYAFLNDVLPGDINDKASPCEESFRNSKWFTRGWTLQELLAPSNLRFYSHDWTHIGDKASSISLINNITGIYDAFLMNADLSRACIAERMSWASLRKVTRKEDIAYSLLGIFGINMPLLYGEGGENAFIRLQEELIKSSNDESIFAWHVGLRTCPVERPSAQYCMGLLARSPSFFEKCTDITQASFGQLPSFIMANGMIRMALLVEKSANPSNGAIFFAHLRCRRRYDFENVLAIPLVHPSLSALFLVATRPRLLIHPMLLEVM